MGNCIQSVAAGVSLLADSTIRIEDDSLRQLIRTAELPDVIHAAGMPDLHPGRGYPVGATFLTRGRIYPALIGSDIGCGMALWCTTTPLHRVKLSKLEKRSGSIDLPLTPEQQAEHQQWLQSQLPDTDGGCSVAVPGTVGGGNHFAEFQAVDTVYDAAACDQYGVNSRNLLLLVHSGSRGLGGAILRRHVEAHGHRGLVTGTEAFRQYMAGHNQALQVAEQNRSLIAARLLLNNGMSASRCLDIHHNLLTPCPGSDGEWLHRKGAAPADQGLVVIPGSRGSFSYLVRPRPSAETLLSLPHGAGRKWLRADCRGRLQRKYSSEQLTRTALGSRVICDNRALLYEEAPEAYKNIEPTIALLQRAGLITLLARLKPLVTYKTRQGGDAC